MPTDPPTTDAETSTPTIADLPGPLSRIAETLAARSAGTESAKSYNGVLSYAAEYHALFVGLAVGFAGDSATQKQVVRYAIGLGGGKRLANDAHVRDMADEPAYAMFGVVVGKSLQAGRLVAPEAILTGML